MKIYYVLPNELGISRERTGNKYIYTYKNSKITDFKTLDRIKNLKIPPGYKKVWICKSSRGHIQAYGYDDQNRKQYIYHQHWTKAQSKKKFNHLLKFGNNLSKIRKIINKNLHLKKLSKEKVMAIILKLLDSTSIRIGSSQYQSHGLLTITKRHINIKGSMITLDFTGKSKKHWHLKIHNEDLALFFKHSEKAASSKLFIYFDDTGNKHTITVNDVNNYLNEITNEDITAKEFRTWKASVLYLYFISQYRDTLSEVNQRICVEKVAKILVNTPRICKNSYIHPILFKIVLANNKVTHTHYLTKDENLFLKILKKNQC